MSRLKKLIIEVHRRSLWQVLTIYLGASWAVLEASDHVVERYFLPSWVSGAVVLLLLVGLPIVLATAFVREEPWQAARSSGRERAEEPASGEPEPGSGSSPAAAEPTAESPFPKPVTWFLTWPRAIAGGVLAFLALGLISAFIVVKGLPRVAEARGEAGAAFEERARLVVADFEASDEEEAEVGEAARAALLVDLQQSRYVNVFTRNQLLPVLHRMGLPDTATIDERLALEVAQREGLAAVLAGAVQPLGSDYVLRARVIDPETGENMIAVRSVASGDRLTEGVEALSREVRRRLGEAQSEIQRSKPLPRVTTRSLEALKKYARADAMLLEGGPPSRAAAIAEEAIRLDSTFAMAYRLASAAYNNSGQPARGREYAERAYELRDRLTDRERLQVEAFHYYWRGAMPEAAEAYRSLLAQYSEDARAANNLAVVTGYFLGEYEDAYRAAIEAVRLEGQASIQAYSNAIVFARATRRWDRADSLIRESRRAGLRDLAAAQEIRQAAGREDWGRAETVCDSVVSADPDDDARALCGSLYIARGRLRRATEQLENAARLYGGQDQYGNLAEVVSGLVLIEQLRGRPEGARARLEEMIAQFPGPSIPDFDRLFVRLHLGTSAAAADDRDLLDRLDRAYEPVHEEEYWLGPYAEGMLTVARALLEGRAEAALQATRRVRAEELRPVFWLPSLELLTALAFDDLERSDSAIVYYESAIAPFNLSLGAPAARMHLPLVVRRLAELEAERGDLEAAARQYRRFLDLWSNADPELQPRVEAARRALAATASDR